MSQRTKNQLAKALMELSRTKSIDDISVKDITDYCELVRNSFYYHFRDKQDLMKYIYMEFRKTLKLEDGYQKKIPFISFIICGNTLIFSDRLLNGMNRTVFVRN